MATVFEGTPGNDRDTFGYSIINGHDGNDELQISVAGGYLEDDVFGDAGNDYLRGLAGDDRVFGGSGRDAAYGGENDDLLYGGKGNDSGPVTVPGNSNPSGPPNYFETTTGMFGEGGSDNLYGGNGRDVLDGGAEDDLLLGGKGGDWLTGGEGGDTVRFKAKDSMGGKAGKDIILDFGEGDVIDVSPIDAVKGKHGNQAFDYIGKKGFSHKAEELRYKDGRLKGDADGDGSAYLIVKIENSPEINAADFLL